MSACTGFNGQPPRNPKATIRWLKITLAVVAAILAAPYLSGRLDYALYPVGLNLHACARNGFGATFCGSDLTVYENRVRGVQQNFQQTMQTVTQDECQADPQLSFCMSP